MKRTLLAALAAVIVASPVAVTAQPAAPSVASSEVLAAAFGLFAEDGAELTFQPASTVPLVVGQKYGWVMAVRTSLPTVRFREEFILPAPAKTWGTGGAPDVAISSDARTSTMVREVEPQGGVISNIWTVAAGDPTGKYVMKVTVEGAPETVFTFDVK